MEVAGFAWFTLEVGKLGEVPLAASNIAFSVNALVFMPMLGMNAAVASLVGRAMGAGLPEKAARATYSALRLCLLYMLPMALAFFLFAGPLMDIFPPAHPSIEYGPIRATGMVLIYYIAVYSLVDSCNIVFLGALKGAGDTFSVMLILGGTGVFVLLLPIAVLKALGLASLHPFWAVLTAYLMCMALCAHHRFRKGKWRRMRVVG
jgi:MATE family multidrug resistance protein